jgi:hypothetical protein
MEAILILFLVLLVAVVIGYVKHVFEERRRRLAPTQSAIAASLPAGVSTAEPAWTRLLTSNAGPGQGAIGLLSVVKGRDGYESPELTQYVTTGGDRSVATRQIKQLLPGVTTRDASSDNMMLDLLAGLEDAPPAAA